MINVNQPDAELDDLFARAEAEEAEEAAWEAAMNTVIYEGEQWNVLSLGIPNGEGKVLAHLAHPTRKIGIHPVQVFDWVRIVDIY